MIGDFIGVEQVRDTARFMDMRAALDMRQAGSSEGGSLVAMRSVQPVYQLGDGGPRAALENRGGNVTLTQQMAGEHVFAFTPDYNRELAGLDTTRGVTTFIVGYGARQKAAGAGARSFNLRRVVISDRGNENIYGPNALELPSPFRPRPVSDASAAYYGGWTHWDVQNPIPVFAPGATKIYYDLDFDPNQAPIVVALWVTFMYDRARPQPALSFPRTGG